MHTAFSFLLSFFRRTDYGLDGTNSEVEPYTASIDLCVGFLRQDLAFRVFFRIKAPRFRHDRLGIWWLAELKIPPSVLAQLGKMAAACKTHVRSSSGKEGKDHESDDQKLEFRSGVAGSDDYGLGCLMETEKFYSLIVTLLACVRCVC